MNDWKDENNAANENNIDNAVDQPKAEDNQTLVDNTTNGLNNNQIKLEPVDTKETDSKIEEAITKQESEAQQELKVENAKQEFMQQLEDAKDEKALANEITNTETLVTDENSVIDPKVAKENAAMINPLSMDQIKVMPVSSTTSTNNSTIEEKPVEVKKEVKIKKATNWHRKLYFVAPLLSGLAVAGALAPIAIIKPIKAMQPNITIDDDSSEGITVKSSDLKLNKDSTITLDMDTSQKIIYADVYVNNNKLESNLYSFDSMSNVISIKAEAMISFNIRLKLTTDAPRFETKFDSETSGLKNVTFSSKSAKYRQELTITCELRDGYILDQNSLSENELQLYVNDKLITDPAKVVVKQLQQDNTSNKYTITIQKGVIDGPVVLTGGIKNFKSNIKIKEGDTNVKDIRIGSFEHKYKDVADIQDILYLNDGGIKPEATITVDDNGRTVSLIDGNDYVIKTNYRDNTYCYDLVWTENGKNKILGPMSIELSANKGNISFTSQPDVIALGLNGQKPISAKIDEDESLKVSDIRIEGDDHGYKLDENNNLVIKSTVDDVTAGDITIVARYQNAVGKTKVKIETPVITITGDEGKHEVKVRGNALGVSATITPAYIAESVDYEWSSDDESIVTITKEDVDKANVFGHKVGTTNIVAKTTVAGKEYKGKLQIDSSKFMFSTASWGYVFDAVEDFYKSNKTEDDMKKLCSEFADIEYNPNGTTIEEHLVNFIGQERNVTLFDNANHKVRVIGICHDTIADGEYAGQKALFTFDSVNIVSDEDGNGIFGYYDDFNGTPTLADGNRSKNWWYYTENAMYKTGEETEVSPHHHESNLYKMLNSEDTIDTWVKAQVIGNKIEHAKDDKGQDIPITNNSIYKQLDAFFGEKHPIKKVNKITGVCQYQHYGNDENVSYYTLEKYNCYCFPLTSVEINQDLSKITEKNKFQHSVKNEGTPYKYYLVDEPNNLAKKFDINQHISNTGWLLSTAYLNRSSEQSESGRMGNFGSYVAYSDGNIYGGVHINMGPVNGFSTTLSYAFCI